MPKGEEPKAPEKQPPEKKPPQDFKTWALGWIKSIAVALAIWLVLRTFVIEAFRIPSASMENTLLVGDFLFVSKMIYGSKVPLVPVRVPGLREPRRGEVVVFKSVEGNFNVVKRLIGMPGDTLEMRHSLVIRNGDTLIEPYAQRTDSGPRTTWGPRVVGPDSFFMLGDNRDNSMDSRYWGPVPRGNIRGKPLFIYYSYDPGSWRSLPFLTAIRWKRLLHTPS